MKNLLWIGIKACRHCEIRFKSFAKATSLLAAVLATSSAALSQTLEATFDVATLTHSQTARLRSVWMEHLPKWRQIRAEPGLGWESKIESLNRRVTGEILAILDPDQTAAFVQRMDLIANRIRRDHSAPKGRVILFGAAFVNDGIPSNGLLFDESVDLGLFSGD